MMGIKPQDQRTVSGKGILVNVVDDKDYCGFLFPSLVKEGKLTAGISTAGASPQIAAELRSRMARELQIRWKRSLII
ncbi:MAG: hypothetical protein ACLVCH_13460 [Roseburia inulinivorans]